MDGSQWSQEEVSRLISLWGEASTQAKLNGSYRNRAVYEEISRAMHDNGYNRTWLQCQRKIKSVKGKYKEIKDHNNRSGQDRLTCPFYDQLEQILGDKPSCRPPEVLDSFEEQDVMTEKENDDDDDDHVAEDAPQADDTSFASSSNLPSEAVGPESAPESHSRPTSSAGASSVGRKRKNKMETSLEIFAKKFTEVMKEDSDIQLKLQTAQHEHELKMMTLLTQLLGRQPDVSPVPPPASWSQPFQDHSHPSTYHHSYQHYSHPPATHPQEYGLRSPYPPLNHNQAPFPPHSNPPDHIHSPFTHNQAPFPPHSNPLDHIHSPFTHNQAPFPQHSNPPDPIHSPFTHNQAPYPRHTHPPDRDCLHLPFTNEDPSPAPSPTSNVTVDE